VRLALYVFGLRDRPVRNTRITSDDADKLATALPATPAQRRSDELAVACRLDHLETLDKGRRDWLNLLISTSFDIAAQRS
jgi:hypothetical protein